MKNIRMVGSPPLRNETHQTRGWVSKNPSRSQLGIRVQVISPTPTIEAEEPCIDEAP